MRDKDFGRGDRYRVTVEFVIPADSPEDAESVLNEIIKDGILVIASEQADSSESVVDSYDILGAEPAEIDLDSI